MVHPSPQQGGHRLTVAEELEVMDHLDGGTVGRLDPLAVPAGVLADLVLSGRVAVREKLISVYRALLGRGVIERDGKRGSASAAVADGVRRPLAGRERSGRCRISRR